MGKDRFFVLRAILASAAIAGFLCGCESDRERLTEADNGSSVSLWLGERLEVELSGNATTGYTWEIASVNTNVLRQYGAMEYTASSGEAGSAGWYLFRFESVAAGQTPLQMVYRQPWMPGSTNDRTFAVAVSVVTNR